MNTTDLHLLLVEDNPADADLLREVLFHVDNRLRITHVNRLAKALECLTAEPPVHAILLDLGLPDSCGMSALERIYSVAPEIPILVLTGLEDEQLAIESVRHGAQDYLVKGQIRPNRLLRAVHHAIERKKSQEEIAKLNRNLQRRVQELQTIFETAPIGLAITDDVRGNRIRGNLALEAMLGMPTGSELSKTNPSPAEYRVLLNGREMPSSELPIQKAVRGETVNDQIFEIVRGNGQSLTLYSAASPLFDEENKPRGAVGAFLDITSLKRAEERTQLLSDITAQLLASDQPQQLVESLCRKAMQYLDCHAFFNFLLDDKSGKLHLNACAGVSESMMRNIEWLDLGKAVCGCVARDGCRIVVDRIQETVDPRAELIRPLGIQAYACHPLMDRDRVIGTLSFGSRTKMTFTDDELSLMKTIADHVSMAMLRIRHLQSLERHAQTAEAANMAKSQFLANISHELRTPMNAILGMTELALEEELSPKLRDYLQTAKESADLLLDLLGDILEFSRIEIGFPQLESIPFSLRHIIDQTLKSMGIPASAKGLKLHAHLPDDLPDRFVGDPIRLRQILLNLIGNAIKFTQEGEIAVSVACNKGETAERASGGRNGEDISEEKQMVLQFSVKDTGIGIAEADQAKIFDPFTQVDASTTRRYGGTGLGLAISASLVKMMGGSIWIESKLNQGSTFHFTAQLLLQSDLPEQSQEDISSSAKKTPPEKVRPLRILLAEDNLANQKMAAYLLEKQGHGVEIIDNGRDAVELAKSKEYDIVLMDVQMPTMDGFEATAAIRALPDKAKARLPIVAMTAHSMKGDKERCLAAGMDGYLTKPICREDLFAVLAKFGNNGKNHH